MHDTVASAMLVVPQFASVCCVVGDRYRPRPGVVVPALVMLVAMLMPVLRVDSGWVVLAAATLLATAPLPVIRRRRPDGRRAEPMDVHRALSAVVMAGMLLMGEAVAPTSTTAAGTMSHGIAIGAVLGGGVIAYCAFSGWLLRYEWGRDDRRTVRSAEVFAMTVAVVGMTLAM